MLTREVLMRPDVRAAALKAAAKVAFSTVLVTGCNGQADNVMPCRGAADCADQGRLVRRVTSDGGEPSRPSDAASQPAPQPDARVADAAGAPPSGCLEIVDAVFPTVGEYPGEAQSVAAEVRACCAELLGAPSGSGIAHRWDCCANLTVEAASKLAMACTPWGPPVPPAMGRVRQRVERSEVA